MNGVQIQKENRIFMNNRVTISMPYVMFKYIDSKVKTGNYGSVSEYIRELIRLDQRIEFARLDAIHERNADLTHIRQAHERTNIAG